jgi:hypothetical protein
LSGSPAITCSFCDGEVQSSYLIEFYGIENPYPCSTCGNALNDLAIRIYQTSGCSWSGESAISCVDAKFCQAALGVVVNLTLDSGYPSSLGRMLFSLGIIAVGATGEGIFELIPIHECSEIIGTFNNNNHGDYLQNGTFTIS